MKGIKQHSVDMAFKMGVVTQVEIIMRSQKEWYFAFEADDPLTGKSQTYTLLTQRGKLRTWSDPRNLFLFLIERYGIDSGIFTLTERETQT